MSVVLIKNNEEIRKINKKFPTASHGFDLMVLKIDRVINKPEQYDDSYFYILYNSKRGICILDPNCYKAIQIILSLLAREFTQEFGRQSKQSILYWTIVDINNNNFSTILQAWVKNNFGNPYMTSITPMFTDIDYGVGELKQSLALTKDDDDKGENTHFLNEISILNDVYYVLEQFKLNSGSCYIHIKLSKNAVDFLKTTSLTGYTMDKNGKKSQKELTGELVVSDVIKKVIDQGPLQGKEEFVYIIKVDEKSIVAGLKENVDVRPTRYNFHSHPHEAYIRHSVENAWPSVTDYLGYKTLGNNTIFHIVATLEGIYILSFSPHWGGKLDQVSESFIEKKYHIDHKKGYTPEEYIDVVNNILYKGYPIYNVKYFSWEHANTVFKVFFPQTGGSCITTGKTLKNYKKANKG